MPLITLTSQGAAVPLSNIDGPVLLRNRDLVNSIIVGDTNGISGANPNQYSIIDPLGSVSYDDVSDLFAQALTGTAVLDVISGANGATPSATQIAAQIAAAGVSLLAAPVQLLSYTNMTLTANQLFTTPVVPCGYLGYEMSVSSQSLSGVSQSPFLRVIVTWWADAAGTVPVRTVKGFIANAANGNASPLQMLGQGPMHGSYVSVVLNSQDNIPVLINFNFTGSGRSYNRHDWRESLNATTGLLTTVNGFTRPTAAGPDTNTMGAINVNLNNGQNKTYLLPFISGRVGFHFYTTSNPGSNVLEMQLGQENDGLAALVGYLIDFFCGGSVSGTYEEFILPRDHMYMFLSNNMGTANTSNFRMVSHVLDY